MNIGVGHTPINWKIPIQCLKEKFPYVGPYVTVERWVKYVAFTVLCQFTTIYNITSIKSTTQGPGGGVRPGDGLKIRSIGV